MAASSSRSSFTKSWKTCPGPSARPMAPLRFAPNMTVERQYEVVEPFVLETTWIPLGRDTKIEQVILAQLKKCF